MAYGVVEMNRISAQKTKQIFAQLPASSGLATAVSNELQNGMILVYDVGAGTVRLPTDSDSAKDLVLHKSAEKLYDANANELGDFVLDLTEDVLPRCYALTVNDTYTATMEVFVQDFATLSEGDTLYADVGGGTGKVTNVSTDNIAFGVVAKKTTAPNGSDSAIKVAVTL